MNNKGITKTIEVKTPLTEKEKDELLKQISSARKVIREQEDNLKAFREDVKEECEKQEAIIDESCDRYEKGFTTKLIKATVVYDKDIATFYDAETGEKVEERPMTYAEQLSLTDNKTVMDAEEFIRRANLKEEENDNGDDE